MRSFWRKTQGNETIAQLSDLEWLRPQMYPFCFDVSLNSKEWLKTFYAFKFFSLKVLKFDLYLSKQSISRALKRALKRAYLMIVGQSLHFTSCYWRCNLCTAIFHRRVWSMNSKEWLQTFYAFKFCSPTVFNFDFHKIEKGIFQRGACEACLQVVLSRTFP